MGILFYLVASPFLAQALPINFGHNQSELEFREVADENFRVLYEKNAPGEGRLTLDALQASKPIFDRWFGVPRDDLLHVILAPETTNASFANFAYDQLELQARGFSPPSLAWHEYTHAMTYAPLENFLGPAGSIIYLAWIPAWFLEGLSEALTASVGTDQMAGIERFQAMRNEWLTYDELHSLYSTQHSTEGYAISGAFVKWIFEKYKVSTLKALLKDIRRYAEPWWWPWGIFPWNGFLPVDEAFKKHFGKKPEQLYTEYKRAAKSYWAKRSQKSIVAGASHLYFDLAPESIFSDVEESLESRSAYNKKSMALHAPRKPGLLAGNRLLKFDPIKESFQTILSTKKNKTRYGYVDWDDSSELALRWKPGEEVKIPKGVYFLAPEKTKRFELFIGPIKNVKRGTRKDKLLVRKAFNPDKSPRWLPVNGYIEHAVGFDKGVFYLVSRGDSRKLCYISDGSLEKWWTGGKLKSRCILSSKMPEMLEFKGQTKDRIFIQKTIYSAGPSMHQLISVDMNQKIAKGAPARAPYVSAAEGPSSKQILTIRSHHNSQSLEILDANSFKCRYRAKLHDLSYRAHVAKKNLHLMIYGGTRGYYLARTPLRDFTWNGCPDNLSGPLSPIGWALAQNQPQDLLTALKATSLRKNRSSEVLPKTDTKKKKLDQTPPKKPAPWRPRGIMLFPWVGSDDPESIQIGVTGQPIAMDSLQNETLTTTLLYGPQSNYPATKLRLDSERFWPSLYLSARRQPLWQGSYFVPAYGYREAQYQDETGVGVGMTLPWYWSKSSLHLDLEADASDRKNYIGFFRIREGQHHSLGATLRYALALGKWNTNYSASHKVIPAAMNDTYEYEQSKAAFGAGRSFYWGRKMNISFGLDYARTRGPKRPVLEEFYQALQTFIPGSGGGLNEVSFPLSNSSSSLFSTRYGETKARAKTNIVFPIVPRLNKRLWILYIPQIDFAGFVNYGGTWFGPEPAPNELILAHGYRLDALFENKGFRFHTGIGTGQVYQENWQYYLSFGYVLAL